MAMVPLRAVLEVLGATARVTVPGPVPELAPDTVIQLGNPEVVHEQEIGVWMVTVKLPPEAGACKETGATE
jgi:hypothetical protein